MEIFCRWYDNVPSRDIRNSQNLEINIITLNTFYIQGLNITNGMTGCMEYMLYLLEMEESILLICSINYTYLQCMYFLI